MVGAGRDPPSYVMNVGLGRHLPPVFAPLPPAQDTTRVSYRRAGRGGVVWATPPWLPSLTKLLESVSARLATLELALTPK